jgi:DNA-binding transcriptional MerR regulator
LNFKPLFQRAGMPEPTALKISELAQLTGTTPPSIRYYEDIGLLPIAGRQGGGQRRYDATDVRRLTFIRRCRAFGFGIGQVRELLALLDDRTRRCVAARDIGQAHLYALRAKMTELRALERSMTAFVRSCDAECAGGCGAECVPLQRLASR